MNIWKYIYISFQFFLILSEKYAILFRMIDIFEWKDFQNHLNFEISYDTFFFCIFYMSNIVTASFSFTRSVKRAEKINFGKSKVPQAHCMNVLPTPPESKTYVPLCWKDVPPPTLNLRTSFHSSWEISSLKYCIVNYKKSSY